MSSKDPRKLEQAEQSEFGTAMTHTHNKHLHIPGVVREKLKETPSIEALTLSFVGNFNIWLEDAQCPFFPEYTDHGAPHLNSLLETEIGLISNTAWDILTPTDMFVLVMATACHDVAMYLTEYAFQQLVLEDKSPLSPLFQSDTPWRSLWNAFLVEARHFGRDDVVNILGPNLKVRAPPRDVALWTLADKKLIGEFIRRHHPRLGHQMLVHGVPTSGNVHRFLEPADRGQERLLELAGVIARSHGYNFRECTDVLAQHFDRDKFHGCHPAFLMALLRVGDYLQIGPDRAKENWFKFREFRSPFSIAEWKLNQCVENIDWSGADPEAIQVIARPRSSTEYIKLRDLLNSIQAELDNTWAVLGECYGLQTHRRLADLATAGLKLRRIRSNVQRRDVFERSGRSAFVPDLFRFGLDDNRVMQLFVGPLYDYDPNIGLRELVQNAVDAVRQRMSSEKGVAEEAVKVCLDLDRSGRPRFLEILDIGIGMTEEVIARYFLRLGASFQDSEEWRRQYVDETGKPFLARTGRFGVGALAAFLLGDKVEVWTRAHQSNLGYSFSFELGSTGADVFYSAGLPIGTRIRIALHERLTRAHRIRRRTRGATYAFPFESSYHGSDPRVSYALRFADGDVAVAKEVPMVPAEGSEICEDWWLSSNGSYGSLHLCPREGGLPGVAYVNGFRVTKSNLQGPFWASGGVSEVTFDLSVYDREMNSVFNLDRSRVQLPEGLLEIAENVVWEDVVAAITAQKFQVGEGIVDVLRDVPYGSLEHLGIMYRKGGWLPYGLIPYFGSSIIEIAFRGSTESLLELAFKGRARTSKQRRDRELSAPIINVVADYLAQAASQDGVFLTTIKTPVGDIHEGTATLSDRRINAFVGVFPEPPRTLRDDVAIGKEVNLSELNLTFDPERALRPIAFVHGNGELSNGERDLLQKLSRTPAIAGVVVYRLGSPVVPDNKFAETWARLIGEAGVPYGEAAFGALLNARPKRFADRVAWHLSKQKGVT